MPNEKKRQRLVRGRDWHAWAWQFRNGRFALESWDKPYYVDPDLRDGGEWVRVRFVEVKRGR